jgi:ABC-type oligopeptide transport system substrate-binding subunit
LLRSKKDFEAAPAYWTMFYSINTTRPPFDNVLVRYALNMAIDKRAIAKFLRAGQTAATGILPSLDGYESPRELRVDLFGKNYDVLSHDPQGARRLLEIAGCGALRVEILYPMLPASKDVPLILRQQWRDTLGADVVLRGQEETVCIQNRNALQYAGVAERGWWADYLDPNTFLEAFLSGPSVIGAGWSESSFDSMLADANAASSSAERLRKLAQCERLLLKAMPVLPLYYNVQAVLKKPFVRGLPAAKVDSVRFKYAWIDTGWRPS